jgi:hypothetical protein
VKLFQKIIRDGKTKKKKINKLKVTSRQTFEGFILG